ncbi:hypothetical protein H4I96_06276 [Botrytis cinerea]
MLLTTIIGAIAGIYLLGHTANYYGISPMIIDKVYRTFPSLFPSPKPRSVDPILEAASRMAAERHLLHPRFNYTMRTIFHISGCTVYGYPSTGGIFIKENANIVDMNFLSLDRLHSTPRSPDPIEEDEFCILMRKIGQSGGVANIFTRDNGLLQKISTIKQKIGLVFGWPSKGGVWVLRYNSHKCNEDLLPRDFGRINMAMNMDERVVIMREYNASFYETEQDVEELGDGYWRVEAD